ncbi:MAG: glycosyltransferase family 4 protein [Chloroflexota bacterium]|nr:glycosyltransferase family 4 protein [Chloroflexota bacterium]
MRILFITGEFPPMQGGVGDCTNEIAKGLAALGAQVSVVTSKAASSKKQAGSNDRLSISPIITQWGWGSLRVIERAAREFAPDIVHIQYQTGAFGMHPAIDFLPRYFRPRPGDVGRAPRRGLEPRPRVVTTFHDLRVPYLFPKAGRARDWVTRELARSSDAVIATNDEDYSRLSTLNLKLLTCIPIGSNISTTPPPDFERAAWRVKRGVAENEMLLCYFGFLNESKGAETLVRALAQTPNAKLLMIGGRVGASDPTNAAYLEKVRALISRLGLTERVIWTNYTPPEIVTANFLASDVCVLPYRDGASYRRGTLMAALAHGRAIVTTQVTSPKSQVTSTLPELRDGENCLMVPPDDPTALALAILRAAALPELRGKIGAGARELAQHFTWDKIARQHLELYERIANRE